MKIGSTASHPITVDTAPFVAGLRKAEAAMMTTNLLRHLPDFLDRGILDGVPHEPKSITNIEAFWWWALVAEYRPNLILESGVHRGRSTHLLSLAADAFAVQDHLAIDADSSHFGHVAAKLTDRSRLMFGDSAAVVDNLAREFRNVRTLVIIDGPKASPAQDRLFASLARWRGIVAIGVHDCGWPHNATAVKVARDNYWPQATMAFPEPTRELLALNESIAGEIRDAWLRSKPGYDVKLRRDVGLRDYVALLATVGIIAL